MVKQFQYASFMMSYKMLIRLRNYKLIDGGNLTYRALFVNTVASGFTFAIGDGIEQYLERRRHKDRKYDYSRTKNMAILGVVEGPPHYLFYGILQRMYPKKDGKSIGKKILFDLFVTSPTFNIQFFVGISLLEGKSLAAGWNEFLRKLPPLLVFDFVFWPMFQVFNFRYVAPEFTVLYVTVTTVFWNIFLSYVKNNEIVIPPYLANNILVKMIIKLARDTNDGKESDQLVVDVHVEASVTEEDKKETPVEKPSQPEQLGDKYILESKEAGDILAGKFHDTGTKVDVKTLGDAVKVKGPEVSIAKSMDNSGGSELVGNVNANTGIGPRDLTAKPLSNAGASSQTTDNGLGKGSDPGQKKTVDTKTKPVKPDLYFSKYFECVKKQSAQEDLDANSKKPLQKQPDDIARNSSKGQNPPAGSTKASGKTCTKPDSNTRKNP